MYSMHKMNSSICFYEVIKTEILKYFIQRVIMKYMTVLGRSVMALRILPAGILD